MTIKNIPSSIDAIIAKNPILFPPFKLNHSIMEIGYFQIMSDSNNSSVKFFVHFKNQKIGFVLQESALINSLTIEDNIKLPFLYAEKKKSRDFLLL